MSKRRPVDKRRIYSKEEKEYILSKTDGRCAHCGKALTIKTMQKDHSIPWSKGGASDVENIVPLCKACNTAKADKIYSPKDYFFHLNKSVMEKMQNYFDNYLKDIDYLEFDNMFSTDLFKVETTYPIMFGKGKKFKYIDGTVTYQKAVYSDLDGIYYFLLDYMDMYGIVDIKNETDLKNYISDVFLLGSFLVTYSTSGEIISVISIYYKPNLLANEKLKDKKPFVYAICLSIFFNLRLELQTFFREDEGFCYTKGISNTYKYLFPLPRIIFKLTSAFDGTKCIYPVVINMVGRDPRSGYILACITGNDIPSRLSIENNEYPIFSIGDQGLLVASTQYMSPDIERADENGYLLVDYSRDLDKYALVNSTKIMSERLKSAHLYHRWMKFHNVNDMVPAYKYAEDLGISYNELVNKLIKEGCFSFVDNRGNANDKG